MTLDTVKPDAKLSSSDGRNVSVDWTRRQKAISDRLEFLSEIEDGWYEGSGVALDREGLVWLDQQMADHYVGTALPLPSLCVSVSGNVVGEWSLPRFECMIEIDLEARTGSWVDVELETGEGIEEQILDLNSADGWQWLIDRLTELIAKS